LQPDDASDSWPAASLSKSPARSSQASIRSTDINDLNDLRSAGATPDGTKSSRTNFAQAARSLTGPDRKQALASVNAAAAAAQKWGWGVLARNRQRESPTGGAPDKRPKDSPARPLREPMGRGRPLPPPGMPLPPPEKPVRAGSFIAPKRKPVPPPLLPKRPESNAGLSDANQLAKPSPTKPALPERRKRQSAMAMRADDPSESEVLVVEAPTESAPATPVPTDEEHHDDFFGHGESTGVDEPIPKPVGKPTLPARRPVAPEELPQEEKEEMQRQEIGMYT